MNYINDKNIHLGKRVIIHAYKYNGWLYRSWEFPFVVDKNDEFYVLGGDDVQIFTAEFNSKRCFKSNLKHKTFWIFLKNKWFNVVVTVLPDNKINFYINISSKFIYEEGAFKYFDFDLDFKIFNDGNWCEVDINEFNEGITRYGYDEKLIKIIHEAEQEVKQLIEDGYFTKVFNIDLIHKYDSILKNMIEKENSKTTKLDHD